MLDVAGVSLEAVSKTYAGGDRAALESVTLTIEPGSFFSVLGPSGCGKTTLLRIIAGFEYPTTGRVHIGGRDVTGLSPRDRDILSAAGFIGLRLGPRILRTETAGLAAIAALQSRFGDL